MISVGETIVLISVGIFVPIIIYHLFKYYRNLRQFMFLREGVYGYYVISKEGMVIDKLDTIIDSEIFPAFLSALMQFSRDMFKSTRESLIELSYKNFKVVIYEAENFLILLLMHINVPHSWVTPKLRKFGEIVEEKFGDKISAFSGIIERIDGISSIFFEIFQPYLRSLHEDIRKLNPKEELSSK